MLGMDLYQHGQPELVKGAVLTLIQKVGYVCN